MQGKNHLNEIFWDPMQVLQCPDDYKYALIVLNQPILLPQDQVLPLWEKAQVTVTVDGGTNHWIKYLGDKANDIWSGKSKKYLPMLVTGDMDSILPNLLEKIKLTQTKVVYTMDTMNTDYTKAIIELLQYVESNSIQLNAIHVLAETCGRLDQIVANINTLYKCEKIKDMLPVFHIASNSITWLLSPSTHVIKIPEEVLKSNSWCSIIPFGSPDNSITTTGLKYNLNKTCMKFGDLLSTSNTYDDKLKVTITTNVSVVWIMGIEVLTKIYES